MNADVLCDRCSHDDGDRIVGSGDIHQSCQQADSEHAPALSGEMPLDKLQDRFKTTVLFDKSTDRCHKDRYDHGLKHSGSPGAHGGKGGDIVQHSGHGSRDHKQDDPDSQDNENVESQNGQHQNDEIRDCLDHVVGVISHRDGAGSHGDNHENHKCGKRGRKGDAEIRPEFVLHLDSLRLGGGDGRVGNEGKVVSEHGTAYDSADTQRQWETAVLGSLRGDRDQDCDSPDTGSHCHGNQAGDYKQSGDCQLSGNDAQKQIGCAGSSAGLLGDSAECACSKEDEEHDRNIVITDTLGADMDLLVEVERPVLHEGNDQSDREGNDDGHDIEAHLTFQRMQVFEIYAGPQIQDQEYDDRHQRQTIWFLCRFFISHEVLPSSCYSSFL